MDPAIVSHKIKQQVSEKMVNLAIDSTLLTIKHAGGTGLDNNVSSLTPTLISTPSLSPTSSHHSRTPFTARIERTLTYSYNSPLAPIHMYYLGHPFNPKTWLHS
jgi:hypothetical protein